MNQENYGFISRGDEQNQNDAKDLGTEISRILQDRSFRSPIQLFISIPEYEQPKTYDERELNNAGDRSFEQRRAKLIDEIGANNPRLVVFYCPERSKLAEQVCSIMSRVFNFDCVFVYIYGDAKPKTDIPSGKGVVIPHIDSRHDAMAICDYIISLGRCEAFPHRDTDFIAQPLE